MSNPTLGTVTCPTCGTEGAEVRQSKRRGGHLYWQCPDCGLSQPTGATIQKRLWSETQWATGVQPIRPANVPADAERPTPTEFDPSEPEPETEAPTDPRPSAQPSPARGVGVLLLGALGVGAFLATR